jgi:hypothetical protein
MFAIMAGSEDSTSEHNGFRTVLNVKNKNPTFEISSKL